MPHRLDVVEVAIPIGIDRTFCYKAPEGVVIESLVGKRVQLPFGRRKSVGYVLGPQQDDYSGKMKSITAVLDDEPLFAKSDLDFYRWIANYYQHPLGEVIKTALPAGLSGSASADETTGRPLNRLTERIFTPTAKVPPASLKGKALTILVRLNDDGELSSSSLKTFFGECGQQLKRLLELGLVEVDIREVYRTPLQGASQVPDNPKPLTEAQERAFNSLKAGLNSGGFAPFLLHGVTGSGKTEVYLQAIAHALELGKSALVMVPEIALTPQLVERFCRRFSCGIAVLHSGISAGERYDEWRRIRRGEARIVIGARSAIFAPLADPGIIVIDEEHEGSYKQSDGLRYNARDMALVLGKLRSAVVLLGSATPLVTTVHAARSGRMSELILPSRVAGRPMPKPVVVDVRGKKSEVLSSELTEVIQQNLDSGGQTLLFLNRRGFAPWLVCQACGFILNCPNCSVTLTYHLGKNRNICHYCDHSIPAPSLCPKCDGGEIGLFGLGTERLEASVAELFPDARVARMDRDSTKGRGGHSRILKKLESGEIDILIGTQMIAKGHDFPGVTLVGVVSADTAFNIPDFRGSERGFQLLTQVSGRAGRGENPGKVLIQTLNPEHPALIAAVEHNYERFYEQELAERMDAGYPPFTYLAAMQFSSNSSAHVESGARDAASLLRKLRQGGKVGVEILGPTLSPLGMVRGRHRWQILLKSPGREPLHRLLRQFRTNFSPATTLRYAIDIDPLELL